MIDKLFQLVANRYRSKKEIAKYQSRALSGLLHWETTVTGKYLSPPSRLLDIGCGCGREAFALHGCGHQVSGIDPSAEQIEIARSVASQRGLNVEFNVCDPSNYQLGSESFTYIIMWSQVLGNIPGASTRLAVLRQCQRMLEPKGILSVSVHNRDVCEAIARQRGLIQGSSPFSLEDGDFIETGDSESDSSCYWHYFTRTELTGAMETAGLHILECDVASSFGQAEWDTILVAVARKDP